MKSHLDRQMKDIVCLDLLTRRSRFHQSQIVEHLQPPNPAFDGFTRNLAQAAQGAGFDCPHRSRTWGATITRPIQLSAEDSCAAAACSSDCLSRSAALMSIGPPSLRI